MAERVPGMKKFLQKINKLRKRHSRQVRLGLAKCGRLLLRLSLKKVPVHTGRLRGSGNVRIVGVGFRTTVTVGYGTEYGIFVHEDLTKAHGAEFNQKYAEEIKNKVDPSYYFKRRPEEQAKFLEEPFRENRRRFKVIIAAELKK